MKRRIAEEWQGYRRKVIPANASSVQLKESEKAFFGGASAAFFLMKEHLCERNDPPEVWEAFLDDLLAELCEFADSTDPSRKPS